MNYMKGCGGRRRHGLGVPDGSERLSARCNYLGGDASTVVGDRFDGYFLIFSFYFGTQGYRNGHTAER